MILAYIRVSREDLSIENQKHAISSRYNIEQFYIDHAVSGSLPACQRPQLSKLLQSAKEGDTLIVAAIDRLGRNTKDVLDTVEHLLSRKVEIISLREGVDFSTPMGKVVLTILAAMAELERASLIERTRAGLDRVRASGRVLGRPPVYDHEAIAAYAQCNTINATAAHFGCDRATVRRSIRKAV